MAAMDSTPSQLQIQIPQLPRPDESLACSLGSGSMSASTTSSFPEYSCLRSPRSNFDFTWAPDSQVATLTRQRLPPGSTSPYGYSCGSTTTTISGTTSGTSAKRHYHVGGPAGATTSSPPRSLAVSVAAGTAPARTVTTTLPSRAPPPPPPPPCFLPAAPISGLAPSLLPAPIPINNAIPTFTQQAPGFSLPSAGAPSAPPPSSSSLSPTSLSPQTKTRPFKMPSRPAKRSADVGGASDDDAGASNTAKAKLPRSERGPEDFSSVVKNRLQSYSRTGQACDRCKVRKIRCDAAPEGCTHCINLNLDCYVTDRVTGRTERRGYMQQLEREKKCMLSHIRDLEQLCAERGVQVKPWQGDDRSSQSSPDSTGEASTDSRASADSAETWSRYHSLWIKDSSPARCTAGTPTHDTLLPDEWPTRPAQAFWGLAGDEAPLSSLRGTKLTLLGTTIETTAFAAPDVDELPADVDPSMPLYNKSVQGFLRSIMGVNPAIQVDLPTRANALMYSECYFVSTATFMPVLHKPSFMSLLTRVYDESDFKPTIPQLVQLHMVFANSLFQFGARNSQTVEQRNNFNDLSNKHYHFALSKMYDMISSPDFEAFQCMVLLAAHTRAFPKPGCGSWVASLALHRALELNLHQTEPALRAEISLRGELRKRAWWCLLATVVAINGKRGNPVPISVHDFDVDFPEPIADELLSESGVDTSRSIPCPYEVAICGFKLVPVLMEMYSRVCSLRRDPGKYKAVLKVLEGRLRRWESELPESMRLGSPETQGQEMLGALYVRTFALEFRLQIRHPSLAMTADRKLIAENTRVCQQAAREYLETVETLSKMKALDTTWYQLTVYCVSILSMLVPQWERRFEVTREELVQLKNEMNRWMNIVQEMSNLLGCGDLISTQIASMIDRTLVWIEHDMRQTAKPSLPAMPIKQEASQSLQSIIPHQLPDSLPAGQMGAYSGVADRPPPVSPTDGGDPNKTYYHTSTNADPSQAPFPSLTYVEQQDSSASLSPASYQPQPSGLYYTPTSAAAHPTSSDSLISYGTSIEHGAPDLLWRNSWQNWTAAMADSQARYSANALLTLGGNGNRGAAMAPVMADAGIPHAAGSDLNIMPQPAQWPMVIFDQTHHD